MKVTEITTVKKVDEFSFDIYKASKESEKKKQLFSAWQFVFAITKSSRSTARWWFFFDSGTDALACFHLLATSYQVFLSRNSSACLNNMVGWYLYITTSKEVFREEIGHWLLTGWMCNCSCWKKHWKVKIEHIVTSARITCWWWQKILNKCVPVPLSINFVCTLVFL